MGDAAHRSPQYSTLEDPEPPAPRKSRGPLWWGIMAIVAAIAGLIIAFFPAPYEFRIALMVIGIVIAIGGIVLAILALRKHAPKGVAVTGLVLSGVVALISTAVLALGIIAEYQIDAMIQRNADELDARLAEERAVQAEIFDKSAWLADARADVTEADFTAVDTAQLEEILADPAAYEDQGIIVDAAQFLPLTADGTESDGLCMTEASLAPTDGTAPPLLARAAIVDRGTPEHCELTDGPFGEEAEAGDLGSFMEDFSKPTRVWLAPTTTILGEDDDDLPVFTLMRVVE